MVTRSATISTTVIVPIWKVREFSGLLLRGDARFVGVFNGPDKTSLGRSRGALFRELAESSGQGGQGRGRGRQGPLSSPLMLF